MFIAALFTIAKTWKQPKCPSADEWVKKMWCVYIYRYIYIYIYLYIYTHTIYIYTQCVCVCVCVCVYVCVYMHAMEYYSTIKQNEIMSFAVTWMDLEIGILSEASQTQKDRYHMILLI